MLLAGLVLALVAAPDALAAPPTLLTAGQANGHATATWSLPPGVVARQVELSLVSSTTAGGGFRFVEDSAVLADAQTSWTEATAIEPGSYYLHVSGHDTSCGLCPSLEWSAMLQLTIPVGSSPPANKQMLLDLETDGTGVGAVTSDPGGIDCRDSCSQAYALDGHVTLTPHPDPGSKFVGWSGGGCFGWSPTCEVVMHVSQTITATFDLIAPPSLTTLTGTRSASQATATFTVCDDSTGALTIAVSQVWKESNGKWQGVTTTTSAQHAAGCDTQTVTVAAATQLSSAWIAVQVTDVDGRQGSLFTVPF